MKDDIVRVWARRRRATLDVWLGRLVTLLRLDGGSEEPSVLLQSWWRDLLTGIDSLRQCRNNAFEV